MGMHSANINIMGSNHITPRNINSTPEELEISTLENSIYYFLQYAFIKHENNGSRLVVTHHERLLLDRLYSTDRGAKIAFSKRYSHRLWQNGIRPKWSPVESQTN